MADSYCLPLMPVGYMKNDCCLHKRYCVARELTRRAGGSYSFGKLTDFTVYVTYLYGFNEFFAYFKSAS